MTHALADMKAYSISRPKRRRSFWRTDGFCKRSPHNKNNSGGNSIEGPRDPALELSGALGRGSRISRRKRKP